MSIVTSNLLFLYILAVREETARYTICHIAPRTRITRDQSPSLDPSPSLALDPSREDTRAGLLTKQCQQGRVEAQSRARARAPSLDPSPSLDCSPRPCCGCGSGSARIRAAAAGTAVGPCCSSADKAMSARPRGSDCSRPCRLAFLSCCARLRQRNSLCRLRYLPFLLR